jgi:HAD superfamily hydrolase (TIGR01662 family)
VAVSPTARARAQADADVVLLAQKRTYAERIRAVQAGAAPPLTNAELALGLDLDERDVGRFVSESPRSRLARPDGEHRALIDAILARTVVMAVRPGPPGARREVLVLDPAEARRLDRSWMLLFGAEVGLRPDELDDDDLWGLGVPKARARVPARPRRLLDRDVFPIVLGAMRLSTAGRPDDADALAVLHAALDAGVQVIDSADSYALDEDDLGHNERLIARLGRPAIVITKAGLRRPGGRWIPDASPERLRTSCEASLRNLGVEALDLLLLHVVDPKVPFAESVEALATLQREGKARAIGLCNVDLAQLEAALVIAPIAAVQVELNRFHPRDLALAERCEALGIPVLAHRPLGGHARRGQPADAAVADVARRLGTTPEQVALAWLLAAAPNILPVVGATRIASVTDSAAAATLPLDGDALAQLDRGMPPRVVGDAVVLISGPPGAGKTTRVEAFEKRGFQRLNRDLVGGTLDGLVPRLAAGLAGGQRRWVLDNTYPTRSSRRAVIEAARAAGVPARSVHIDIPRGEALYNGALRLFRRYGRLLSPEELKKPPEPNDVAPFVIFRYYSQVELPDIGEGFTTVERAPFQRTPAGTQRAVLLDIDGTLRRTRSGAPYPHDIDDIELLPGRRERLQKLAADGWLLLGVSNQSGIARGDVDVSTVEACFTRTAELLGVELPVRYCPHPSGEIRCWCRKPMPGMGVAWIEARDLDRTRCVMVGDMETDEGFAQNLGVPFVWADAFFS